MTQSPEQPFDLAAYAGSSAIQLLDIAQSAKSLKLDSDPVVLPWLDGLRDRLREPNIDGKTNILVIGTGGTFQSAMGPDGYEPTGDLRTSFEALGLPKDETVNLDLVDLMNTDSSQMTVEHWQHLAETIIEAETVAGDLYDAIIVTHGTDTMARGASYLSFMLQGFPKSIVFTGSQHPALEKGGDAKDQMERAITAAKLSTNHNRRITEVMVACGLKVTRGTWATKLGDKTTDAFGPWNQPSQPLDASDWERAAADGSIERHAPALLDLGTGKSRGSLEFARHAVEYGKKGPFRPFTKLIKQAGIIPVRMTDIPPSELASHIIAQQLTVLTLLGSATADDRLVHVATKAAEHGKLVVVEAPFADSTLLPGTYKAGSGISRKIEGVNRSLPIIKMSPDGLVAKLNFLRSQIGLEPIDDTPGLGATYSTRDLRQFYDAVESNLVGELV